MKRWLPGAVAVVDSFRLVTLLTGVATFRHAPYLVGWFHEMIGEEWCVHCEEWWCAL